MKTNMFRCDRLGCTNIGETTSNALECPDGWGVVRVLMPLDASKPSEAYADHKGILCPEHVAEQRRGELFHLVSEAARDRLGAKGPGVSTKPFF